MRAPRSLLWVRYGATDPTLDEAQFPRVLSAPIVWGNILAQESWRSGLIDADLPTNSGPSLSSH